MRYSWRPSADAIIANIDGPTTPDPDQDVPNLAAIAAGAVL